MNTLQGFKNFLMQGNVIIAAAHPNLPGMSVQRPAGEGDPLQVLHVRPAGRVRAAGRLTDVSRPARWGGSGSR